MKIIFVKALLATALIGSGLALSGCHNDRPGSWGDHPGPGHGHHHHHDHDHDGDR